MKKNFVVPVLLLILVIGVGMSAGKQWLHVRVDSEGSEKFNLNLPIALVDTLLPMIEDKNWDRGGLGSHGMKWDDREWTVAELRELWDAVKQERGYDLASFGDHDSQVRLFLDDRYLRVESEDGSKDQVSAKVPIAVVDALLSGEGERLDLLAAIEALKLLGSQEIITVEADRGSVQVWIDDVN